MIPAQLTLAVRYDRDTLSAVANRLFVRRWAPLFPYIYPAILVCGTTAGVASLLLAENAFSGTIILCLTAWAALVWAMLWFRMRHLVQELADREIEFSLDEDQVTVKIGNDRQTLKWEEIIESERHPQFVLLYVTQATALVMPANILSAEINGLIARKVPATVSDQ